MRPAASGVYRLQSPYAYLAKDPTNWSGFSGAAGVAALRSRHSSFLGSARHADGGVLEENHNAHQ
jgi:hypothetical protein